MSNKKDNCDMLIQILDSMAEDALSMPDKEFVESFGGEEAVKTSADRMRALFNKVAEDVRLAPLKAAQKKLKSNRKLSRKEGRRLRTSLNQMQQS